MAMTFEEAVAQVTAPGGMFETGDGVVSGVEQRVFVHTPPNMRSLFEIARLGGDKVFLVYEDEEWTFSDALEQIDALAATLVDRYGVKKGDRVALGLRNYPEWIFAYGAVVSIGAVCVPLNAMWTIDELEYGIEHSGSTVMVADPERVSRTAAVCARTGVRVICVRADDALGADVDRWEDVVVTGTPMPDVDVGPDDDATILYTSGTTGRPKGALSTHGAILSAVMAYGARAGVDKLRSDRDGIDLEQASGPKPVFILIVPLFHVTGCIPVMLGCVVAQLKLVMMYKWDVDKALPLIERHRVTHFVGVPTQSWDLVQSPHFADYDTSSLRNVGGGGAPAPVKLVAEVASSVKGGGPIIGYGMTETNAYGPQNLGDDYLTHPASTGRALPILQVEIRDEAGVALPTGERGEIWMKGPNLIRGYWNDPEATAGAIVDGWLRTGDAGRLDEDGFLYIEDRIKDMILRGGENVYCAEVESAIFDHPAVHEVAVFGVHHERLGEEVAAAVHLDDGESVTEDELRTYLRAKLAAFKVPSHITFLDEPLPRNAAGKFLKRELRHLFD